MVIRRATSAETAALAELAVQLWEGSTVLEFAESFTDLVMNNENAACFLAYEGNQPVGFAQCQLRRDYVEGTETCPVGYLEGGFRLEAVSGRFFLLLCRFLGVGFLGAGCGCSATRNCL